MNGRAQVTPRAIWLGAKASHHFIPAATATQVEPGSPQDVGHGGPRDVADLQLSQLTGDPDIAPARFPAIRRMIFSSSKAVRGRPGRRLGG